MNARHKVKSSMSPVITQCGTREHIQYRKSQLESMPEFQRRKALTLEEKKRAALKKLKKSSV